MQGASRRSLRDFVEVEGCVVEWEGSLMVSLQTLVLAHSGSRGTGSLSHPPCLMDPVVSVSGAEARVEVVRGRCVLTHPTELMELPPTRDN